MVNIFLIKSPLQLLNAIEAKHHYGLDNSDCYLVIMGDRKSNPQLTKLAKLAEKWRSIVFLNNIKLFSSDPWRENLQSNVHDKSQKSFFTVSRINRMTSKITDVGYVFVGDYNNKYMRHFVHAVSHRETVLLDDGAATLEVARKRFQGVSEDVSTKLYKRIKLRAKRVFQGLNDSKPAKVVFFTAYKVNVRNPDRLEINNFAHLRSLGATLPTSDAIYFLGSPLSEVGVMTEDSYIAQLKIVRSQFPDRDFVYVAHRREDFSKLELIKSNTDIRVCRYDYPVEYQFSIIGPKPKTIVSFITSALDTLNIILGNTVTLVSYRLLPGSYQDVNRVDAVYNHYLLSVSESFQVKDLGHLDD